ncbi:MAG: DUF2723 domain-containing protein [Candidatus Coatesbacteria bacterium]
MGLFLAVATPLWALYLRHFAPTVALEDSGEMIRAALALGITHEPGYPLYVLAGHLAALLPVGCVAFRLNLVSATASALAAGTLACLARRLLLDPARPACAPAVAWGCAAAAGWALGLAPTIWWESMFAEKYAVSLLWFVLCLAVVVAMTRNERPAGVALAGLVLGLALAHHGQATYVLPGLAVALWVVARRHATGTWTGAVIRMAIMGLLGFSVKLVSIPIRAAAHPWPDWNHPAVYERWADYLSARTYHFRLFRWGVWGTSSRLIEHSTTVLPDEFGWAAIVLAVAGLLWLIYRRQWRDLAWLLPGATGAVFAAGFGLVTVSLRLYYIPAFAVFVVLAAFGLARVAVLARWRPVRMALAVAVVGWLGWRLADRVERADWSRYYLAHDNARNLLDSAGEGSILVAHGDYAYFPVSFVRYVDRPESKTVVVMANALPPGAFPEQAKRIQLIYPPEEAAFAAKWPWGEDLMAFDPGKPVRFAVIFAAIERGAFVTCGQAYAPVRRQADLAPASILKDRAWFRRWGRTRGLYDARMPNDEHTRQLLVRYPFSDYWRARLLALHGRCAEAILLYRAVLASPPEWPVNRPGIVEGLRACGGRP